MGYRSDIVIAFAFKTKEQIDEVMAVYRMHKFVQEHDLEKSWQTHQWGDIWGLTYSATSVKWYESYEDVQGFEHMEQLVKDFAENRADFLYGYRKIRTGEEDDDSEQCTHSVDEGEEPVGLMDELWDRMGLHREINTSF